jgi:hypothetical protein
MGGGAARASTAIWINPAEFRRQLWRILRHPIRHWRAARRWPRGKGVWSELWGDNIGHFVCKVYGHRPYKTSTVHEPDEWGCHRCHRFIKL